MTQSPSYKLYMNHLLFPYYKSNIEKMNINKFINANNMTNKEIWDNSWDIVVNFINKKVYALSDNSDNSSEDGPTISRQKYKHTNKIRSYRG